jgi:hypothetical protein
VFPIRIGFNADPDPAFYLDADPDPDTDREKGKVIMFVIFGRISWIRIRIPNTDPDPGAKPVRIHADPDADRDTGIPKRNICYSNPVSGSNLYPQSIILNCNIDSRRRYQVTEKFIVY